MYSLVLMMAVTTGSETPAFGRRHGCHGCDGGCYASSCNGGCYSDCGGGRRRGHRRHRCHGCNGGCNGCYASHASYGCHGCSGGYDGAPYMGTPSGAPPRRMPEPVPAPKPGTAPKSTGTGVEETSFNTPAPATITVNLPSDALLTVDDTATTLTSDTRVFMSPELPRDKTFYYTFKGEVIRNGEKVTASKLVQVRGGESTQVTLKFPTRLASN